jgi:hypothetical protein
MRALHVSLGICLAFSSALAGAAKAQFSLGGVGAKMEIVMMPEVQKELKLTGDQKKQIQAASQSMGQGNMTMSMDPSTMNANMDAVMLAPLTPDQLARLTELWIQYEGPRVVQDKATADKLQLTDDQRAKMKTIWDTYSQTYTNQMTHMRIGSRMGGLKKALKDSNAATLALLTDDQAKAFADMQGKKFKFSMSKDI